MKIKTVQIKNFNSIVDVDLDLTKKIIAVTGPNGRGKSSILDAIAYAITGELDYPLSSYVRLGQKSFSIAVAIEDAKGKEYLMAIESDGRSTEKVLSVDGETYTNSTATKKMAEFFDPTLTMYSSVARQHHNTGVLFEKPTERLEKLKKIFRMDAVKEAIALHDEEAGNLKVTIKEEELSLSHTQGKVESITYRNVSDFVNDPLIEEKKSRLDMDRDRWAREAGLHETWRTEIEGQQEVLRRIKELQTSIGNIEEDLSKIPRKLRIASVADAEQNRKDAIAKIDSLESAIGELDDTMHVNRNRLVDMQDQMSELSMLETGISLVTIYIEKLQSEKKEIEDAMNEDERVVPEVKKAIDKLKNDLYHIDLKVESAEKGECVVCGSTDHIPDTTDSETIKSEIKSEIAKREEFLTTVAKREQKAKELFNTISSEQQKLNQQKSGLEKLEEIKKDGTIDKLQSEIGDAYNRKIEIKKEIEYFRALAEDSAVKISNYDSAIERNNQIEEQKTTLMERLEKVKTDLELAESKRSIVEPLSFDFDLDKFNQFNKEYQDFQIEYATYQKDLKRFKEDTCFNEEQTKKEVALTNELGEVKSRIEESKNRIDTLSKSKKFLDKKFSAHLLEQGSKYVCHRMNEFLQKAYGSEYQIYMEMKGNSIEFYYTIGDHKDKLVVGKASGQEKMVISLAFRVAIASMQSDLFFMLDEVDESANSGNSLRMYETLIYGVNPDQLICITHNEETKRFFEELPDAEMLVVDNGIIQDS